MSVLMGPVVATVLESQVCECIVSLIWCLIDLTHAPLLTATAFYM